jgi:NADH dehydrogenase (ubiquinone) Fe-S protein 4
MASLRTSSAARLLRSVNQTRSVLPAARRYESNVPVLNKEQDLDTSVKRTDPNYEAQFDRATSYVYLKWLVYAGPED